jgi:hypothetical protein
LKEMVEAKHWKRGTEMRTLSWWVGQRGKQVQCWTSEGCQMRWLSWKWTPQGSLSERRICFEVRWMTRIG